MSNTSSIAAFYNDRCVFITGATGFMGKVLVEKLLRSCPGIRKIYILIRNKKGMDKDCRIQKMIESKIFDRLKKENPDSLCKLIALDGDIVEPDFNLSNNDKKILKKDVSVVFHFAASISFTEPLKQAIRNNLLSVHYLMQLCEEMTSLVALVHLSTAYSNYTKYSVDEIVYPPPVPPRTIIEMSNNLSDEMIEKMTPILLGGYPNTYSFTKCLAETLLNDEHGRLPVAIVRPSIVGAALKEPYVGWIDIFNGFSGYIVSIGTGLVKHGCFCPEIILDIIPVDVCINLVIAVGQQTALSKFKPLKVYNCTTSSLNPLLTSTYQTYGTLNFFNHPFSKMVRFPTRMINHTNEKTFSLNMIWDFITFIYPLDRIFSLFGKNIMIRKQFLLFWKLVSLTKNFTLNEWMFTSNNVVHLWDLLTVEDKMTFLFDVRKIDWPVYLENAKLGCKRFLLKESLTTDASAKLLYNRLYWIHFLLKNIKWILSILSMLIMWKQRRK